MAQSKVCITTDSYEYVLRKEFSKSKDKGMLIKVMCNALAETIREEIIKW